jgi:ketosteroid isomerase-like protein
LSQQARNFSRALETADTTTALSYRDGAVQRLICSLVALAAFTATAAIAQDIRPADAVRDIVNAETRFAEFAREHGTRAAFLEFLADDAVMFDPGPVKGKELWNKRPENDSLLEWQPAFAALARGCDLGYDTGPWQWRKDKGTETAEAHGHFVSIWKREADGQWKVALDFGIDHPPEVDATEPAEMSSSDDGRNESIDLERARKAAQQAQRTFVNAAKRNSSAALAAAADDAIRVYRQGVRPAVGREAAALMLGSTSGELTMKPAGGGISRTGDLGYDYGKYSLKRKSATERGYYLQVWRTDPAGKWKLALDLQRKLPPEEAKPKAGTKSTSAD